MSWIDVNERLPEYEESVLLFIKNKGVVQGYRFEDQEFSEMKGEYLRYDCYQNEVEDGCIEYDDITNWMPLPPPPSND